MKNTRIFFPLKFTWLFFSLFWFTLSIISGYYVIRSILESKILILLILIFPSSFVLFTFIRFIRFRIIFLKDKIVIPSDWLGKNSKIQYKTTINYKEIKDIKLIRSKKNSLNKVIPIKMISSHVLKTYIELSCLNGKAKRIFVMYFTKKQIIKIINEMKSRVNLANKNIMFRDTADIMSELSPGGIVL